MKEPITNTQIFEDTLEETMYMSGTSESQELNRMRFWNNKNKILSGKGTVEEYTNNPFVKQGFCKTDKEAYLFPVYVPKTELDVKIISLVNIFDNRCGLVFCKVDENNMIYFDPNPDKDKYEQALNKMNKIRLAAISSGSMYDAPFNPNNPNGTRYIHMESGIYKGNFDVLRKIDCKNKNIILMTRNPFKPSSELELLTNTYHIKDIDNLPKTMGGNFFLIGSLY